MNIIFDIGNVILTYQPEAFLKALWSEEVDASALYEVIFASKEWVLLDAGLISHDEAVKRMCTASPENEEYIRQTMGCYFKMFKPFQETVLFLQELKEKGARLYYLSNFHEKASEWILKEFPFFSLFDGGVFSCDVHLNKPDERIYQCLLEKYGLKAEDCVFFDDVKENVDASSAFGIKGIQFFSVSKSKKALEE